MEPSLKTTALIAMLFILGLSGCAARMEKPDGQAPIRVGAQAATKLVLSLNGSDVATTADDWETMKGVWRDAFSQEAKNSGIAYAFQDGAAKHTGEDGTLLAVYVNDYRYVSKGARFGLGVMTGNAFIDSKVRFINLKDGELWGEQPYNTSSTAWEGVFSAMTAKQVEAICKKMIDTSGGK